jgi:hypothetical protein
MIPSNGDNPASHRRHSIRIAGFDYSKPGAYFATICVQNRECLFGEIVDGRMCLNAAGKMVEKWYRALPNKFPDFRIDEYIIMPNHFHSIVIIKSAHSCTNGEMHTVVGADLYVRPMSPDAQSRDHSIRADTQVRPYRNHPGTIILPQKTRIYRRSSNGLKQ